MGLESATYINDLTTTNPVASDAKSQGDDHLRLIKSVLKATINGFTGPMIITGADTGSVNAYALTPSPALGAYVSGMLALFTPSASNTTASTLNISALGTKAIKTVSGAGLSSGDLVAGSYYLLIYDGTDFRIINGPTKNYVDQLSFSSSLPAQAGNGGYYLTTDGSSASWDNLKASPAFTGTPTAPTAAVDTSTTQIATTAFVVNQAYAKLAGPTFTGNVTVPTLAADATSAYAINAAWYGGQAGVSSPIEDGVAAAGTSKKWSPIDHVHPGVLRAKGSTGSYTGSDTLTSAAFGRCNYYNSASPGTLTLPGTMPAEGTIFTAYCLSDGALTIARGGTQVFYAQGANAATSITIGKGGSITLVSDGGSNWIQLASGGVSIAATQTEMEAASSNTVPATPGNMNWHPGVAKCWIKCDAAGNINASHNVTSITDNGTGDVTVTIATDFSSANYAVSLGHLNGATFVSELSSQLAGSFRIISTSGSSVDPAAFFASCFGDQA